MTGRLPGLPVAAPRSGRARALLALGLVFGGLLAGQQTAAAEMAPRPVRAMPGPYRLGPGDILAISVWGQPDLSAVVQVRPDGYISFPLVGEVRAEGRVPAELSRAIAVGLQDYVRDPRVTVIVQQVRTVQASVLGAVRLPGSYELPLGARLTELLGQSGGLLDEADLRSAVLSRVGPDGAGSTMTVDLEAALRGEGPGSSLTVAQGDVLYVPRARPAMVFGAVKQPGAYAVRPGMRLVDLLAAAGGLGPEADPRAVSLIREGGRVRVLSLDLQQPAQGPDDPAALPVRPGDLVYVSPARPLVVLGAVNAPGAYPFRPGVRLLDALAMAGGIDPLRAGLSVTVSHVPEPGEPAAPARRFDLQALADGTDLATNPPLQPGDVVSVEEAPREVAVLGEVHRPGTVPYRAGLTVLDALARAGGATPQAGLEQAVLTRRRPGGEQEVRRLDLRALARRPEGGDPGGAGDADPSALQISLLPGDLLVLPPARREAVVLGAVARPGTYALRGGERLLDLLGLAGGPTEDAALSEVVVTLSSNGSPPAPATLDLRPVLENPGHADNRPVSPGSVLFVPRRPALVTVVGEVTRPGTYRLEPGMRVLDALALAGGLLPTADRGAISLVRPQPVTLDYGRMLGGVYDEAANPRLAPGDVVMVSRAERRVLVLGAVGRPGALEFREGLRLLDAVALAGGPTPQADLAHVTLTRASGESNMVDLADLMSRPGSQANALLHASDVVFVPEAREVLVLGAVARPGSYPVPSEARVLDVVALAGGVREDAGVSRVVVTRRVPQGNPVVYDLDYEELVGAPGGPLDLPVAGNDVVYVPEGQRHVLVLGQVRNPGLYPLPAGRPVRLLDALAMAGGPTGRARLEAIGILRAQGTSEQARAGRGARLFQGQAQQNPSVRPGDVVYVPETAWPDWRDVFGFIGGVKTFVDLVEELRD